MAMSTGSSGGTLSDINVTPLADVLLVLLILFLVTIPSLKHDIQIDLPQPNKNFTPPKNPPTPIELRISSTGTVTWNGNPVDEQQLTAQLLILGTKPLDAQAELRIHADPSTLYDNLAKLLAKAKNAGVQKIGFQK
ncbi:MAG TPA: biopolymer transporter ExbD [Rhodanobacteraceae bacterium]|nr:biopolymer transporter ExbD [Rhodanobacteraceae bacterium]